MEAICQAQPPTLHKVNTTSRINNHFQSETIYISLQILNALITTGRMTIAQV